MSRWKHINKYFLAVWILFVAVFLLPASAKAAEGGTHTVTFLPGEGQLEEYYNTELTVPEGGYFTWSVNCFIDAYDTDGNWTGHAYGISREGYYLKGWMNSAGEVFPTGEPVYVTEDMELTAQWGKVYTITFNPGEGQIIDEYSPTLTVLEDGSIYIHNDGSVESYQSSDDNQWIPYSIFGSGAISRAGYYLKGWQNAGGEDLTIEDWIPVTEDMELTAQWGKVYTVTLDPGEGQVNEGCDTELLVPEGGSININSDGSIYSYKASDAEYMFQYDSVTSDAFSKEGYYLKGWTNSKGQDLAYNERIPVTEDTVLTANWGKAYTVTLDLGEGQVNEGWDTKLLVPEGGGIIIQRLGDILSYKPSDEGWDQYDYIPRDAFRNDGYYLKGWKNAEGEELAIEYQLPVTEDMELIAVWGKACMVTFSSGEGDSSEHTQTVAVPEGGYLDFYRSTDGYIYDENNKYVTFFNLEGFYKDGVYLKGWKNESGDILSTDGKHKITEDTLLTANWVEGVTVTLDPNGGSLRPGYEDAKLSLPKGGIIAISRSGDVFSYMDYSMTEEGPNNYVEYLDCFRSRNFEREGYVLIGWQDASGNRYSSNKDIPVDESMTISAVWSKTNTISFNLNGGIIDGEHSQDETVLSVPERGYIQVSNTYISSYMENGDSCDQVSFETFSKEGYILTDLQDENENTLEKNIKIPIDKDTVYKLVWTKAYKISFQPGDGNTFEERDTELLVPEGGSIYASKDGNVYAYAENGEDEEEIDAVYENSFYKENSYLKGWKGTDGKDLETEKSIPVTEDKTYTAVWDDVYTLKLDLDGGAYDDDDNSFTEYSLSVPKDGNIRISEDGSIFSYVEGEENNYYSALYSDGFSKEDSYLKGWKGADGKTLETGKMNPVQKDMTFTADWGALYTVTLNSNGAGSDYKLIVPDDGYIYINNEYIESYRGYIDAEDDGDYYDYVSLRYLKNGNKYLKGWTKEDGTLVEKNTKFYPDGDTELKADWADGHIISFDPNGGTEDEVNPMKDIIVPVGGYITVTYGGLEAYDADGNSITVRENGIYHKEGGVLDGWIMDGKTLPMVDADEVEPEKYYITKDTVLKASWGEGYKVTLDAGEVGFRNKDQIVMTVPKGGWVEFYDTSANTNYKDGSYCNYYSWRYNYSNEDFLGWSDGSSTVYRGRYDVTKDVTLSAQWGTKIEVTDRELDKTALTLEVGQTVKLNAKLIPENATDKQLYWGTWDPDIASIDDEGNVTGREPGTTTIYAYNPASRIRKECKVTVVETAQPVAVTGVSLNKNTLSLTEGENATLTATVEPANADNKNVIWTSADETVATVVNGKVTAVKEGTTTITVTTEDSGKTAECQVTVNKKIIPVTSVTLDKNELSMVTGNTAALTATVAPEDATDKSVAWTSADENIATVSASGVVTAVKEGTTTITVTTNDGNLTAECQVTITDPVVPIEHVTAVSLDKKSLTMTEGDTQTLTATIEPENADNKNVIWTSKDSSIATVDNGTVTAVKEGTTTITVTSEDGGKTAECQVTVNKKTVPVTSVALDKSELSLLTGNTGALTATVMPADATDKSVTWTSSDESIATVSNVGLVRGAKAGKATITVTTKDGGKTASCAVTVTDPVIRVTAVSLNKTSTELTEGGSETLAATVAPANATDKTISWTSSNTAVATVSADGKVQAVKAGTAVITVTTTDGRKTAACTVTVKAESTPSGNTPAPSKSTPAPVVPAENPQDAKLPSLDSVERAITTQAGDGDPSGSSYILLQARVSKNTKNSNKVVWSKVAGATGYAVYGNLCGNGYKFAKIANVTATSFNHTGLKKGTYYKYLVVAYKKSGATFRVLATSKTMHAATKGGKVGNAKSLKVKKAKVVLKKNKTFKVKATEVPASKKLKIKRHRKVAFESSNPAVATVSSSGKIKAKSKGKCYVYAYAQNGIFKKIKVQVK